ncbi:MAG: hypothetical protein J6B88_00720 [Clostridia bacterium]|nr:hypothetical protein [Clostridia bacterium]
MSSDAIQPWVEWKHITMGKTHCPTCLRLDKCWFSKSDMPALPQHKYCHCTTLPKSFLTIQKQATANSTYSKYNPYLFDPKNEYKHGKDKLFNLWGYTIEDSQWLKTEIERQGLEKYVAGQYKLNWLDYNGQRINIIIKIPRRDKSGEATFTTGWMVYPNGKIQLITPYADD